MENGAAKITVVVASQGKMKMVLSKSLRIGDIHTGYFDGPVTLEVVEVQEAGLRLCGAGYGIDAAQAHPNWQPSCPAKKPVCRTVVPVKKSVKKPAKKPAKQRRRKPLTTSDPADWEDCT